MNKINIAFELRRGEWLQRIRPAVLASWIKKCLRIQRFTFTTELGTFWVDPASNFGIRLLRDGIYEPHTCAALRQLIQPGFTVVDLGANEGYLTVVAALATGSTGRVYSIEPQTRLMPVLKKNLELNQLSNVTLTHIAISDQSGAATLHLLPDINTGGTSLAQVTRYQNTTQSITTCTLAQFLDQHQLTHIDLLKVDIEGWEWEAIMGSPELFRSGHVALLYLELHDHLLRKRGLEPQKLLEFLTEAGFQQDQKRPEIFRHISAT